MIKAKDFRKVGRRIQVPFLLPLNRGEDPVLCEEVLRVVPGKRVAFKGEWKNREVFVKLFFKRFGARRHVRRELSGYNTLCTIGLPTPKLLHVCEKSDEDLGIILFEYIKGAVTLADLVQVPSTESNAIDLVYECVNIIAKMHERGILHLDPHLGNFLVIGDKVVITDCASIAIGSTSSKGAFKNLAYYLAQLPWDEEDRYKMLISHYLEERNLSSTNVENEYILKYIRRHQERMLKKYRKKLFRESSQIGCNRSFWEVTYYKRAFFDKESDVHRLIKDALYQKETVIIKNGRTSTVFIVQHRGRSFVVKRYNIKTLWHGLRKAFMRSRASKSWENSHLLKRLGIATPTPVAMIEERIGPLRRTAYFVYEYVDGIEAHTFFKGKNGNDCEEIVRELVELLGRLYKNRILHGDTKASNFIVTNQGIYVVDLDAMKVRANRAIFRLKQRKEVARFLKNWNGNDPVRLFIKRLVTEKFVQG